jgi:hypothetical protein
LQISAEWFSILSVHSFSRASRMDAPLASIKI